MPQFNVYWKGYPRRRLPRIRLASSHYYTVSGSHYARFTALEDSQQPFSLALQKARLQQRIRVRERNQFYHISLGDTIDSIRNFLQAMSSIRLCGLENPLGELEARVYPRNSSLSLLCSGDNVDSAKNSRNSLLSINGQSNSAPQKLPTERAEVVDPKHMVENKTQRNTASGGVRGKHYQGVSTERVGKNSIHRRVSIPGRSRTYDPRLPIRRARRLNHSKTSNCDALNRQKSLPMTLEPAMMERQPLSTAFSIQDAKTASTSSDSTQSTSQQLQISGVQSRSPTQQAALEKFSRELKRHLIAQSAVREACLSQSSLSSSSISADTIVEFIPYMAEFQAAELAVTSVQQRKHAVPQPKRKTTTLLPKESRDKEQVLADTVKGMSSEIKISSRDGSGASLYTDITSSRTTVISFSTCKELDSNFAYHTRNIPIKKPLLPWLRKERQLSSISPNHMTPKSDTNPFSKSTCDTCTTTIVDFPHVPANSERTQIEIDPSSLVLVSRDDKYTNTDACSIIEKNKEFTSPVVPQRPVCVPVARQIDLKDFGKTSGNNTCAFNISPMPEQRTQTVLDRPELSRKEKAKLRDENVPQGNGGTFPTDTSPKYRATIGPFRASGKLLAPLKAFPKETLGAAGVGGDVVTNSQSESMPLPPAASAHSPSSHPISDPGLTSKLNHESSDQLIQDQYGFETPSIFELALHDVESRRQSLQEQFLREGPIATRLSTSSSAHRSNRDPVKRRSTPYNAPKFPSCGSNVTAASSVGSTTTSQARTTISTDCPDIHDKDVLKGLQIARAAACNKNVDLWITQISGYQVRRFLADLRALEGLGVNTLAKQAKRTANMPRDKCYRRMMGPNYGYVHDLNIAPAELNSDDTNGKRRSVKADDNGRRGLLIAQMLSKREDKAEEIVNERALRMGWRIRSVSAGC